MVTLLLVVAVAILLFTHLQAYHHGHRRAERMIYRRYYRPLLQRHNRLAKFYSEAIVDDTATAQQKNVKLVATNAILRGKAIAYLKAYREATRHRRQNSRLDRALRMMTATLETAEQLNRVRSKLVHK